MLTLSKACLMTRKRCLFDPLPNHLECLGVALPMWIESDGAWLDWITMVIHACRRPAFMMSECVSLLTCQLAAVLCNSSKGWAEAHIKIARMTLTVKLDRNWSSFQLANSAPPLSVTDSAIAPSARMLSLLGRASPAN